MPIKPFIDRKEINLSTNDSLLALASAASGSFAAPCIDAFKQGVSLKTSKDVFSRLLPFVGSKGLPLNFYDTIDFSLERTTYGNVELFSESSNGSTVDPFDDISSLNNPVTFLKDDGLTAYPQVMLSPNWLDPGLMNGIIEPLDLRGTLPGASVDSPFVARTIKASIMDNPYPYRCDRVFDKKSTFDVDVAFIDSQNLGPSKDNFHMFSEPIGDFGRSKISPYDELIDSYIVNDLKTMSDTNFNDTIGLGIISRGVGTIMNYNSSKIVQRGESGFRNLTVVDSIAFGGLVK